ncbi:MAG: M3 family oligoendopeptidase, partial [Romboutsia sp.]
MDYNWNLKGIYSSFDSIEFKGDIEKLIKKIGIINLWVEDINKECKGEVEIVEEYIKEFTELNVLANRLSSFINLSLSVDTKDKEALKYSDILDKELTEIVEASTKIEKYISNIGDIDDVINKSKLLKEHEFILKTIVQQSKYSLSDREEKIIASMKNTGSNAWSKLKDNLISTLKVDIEIDGENKQLPLTVVLNMANDKDKEIRKKAYLAEIKSYKKVEEGVASALNGIKGEVITTCGLRGYKSPLDETLINSRMDEETLNSMLEAMKDSLPIFRKYLKQKAKILGYDKGLPFYELYAPVSSADMKFTYEKGAKFVEDNFRTFSDRLGDFAKRAIENSWVDVYPREGKVGGAFCDNLHFIGESRFLLNYGDSFSDVVTLAHELGHGFHGECLKDETPLNSDYPMPIAETASTFCETIIKKAAIKNATKEEAMAILESEISDCTQVIVDIYSRFLFEKSVFEKRKESAL